MTKIRLSRPSRPASEIAPSDSGSSHSPSPEKRPDLARRGVRETASLQVLEKARLVDRHQRAEAHRHGGKLPEIRHQPRVRIRGNALAFALLAEVQQQLLREAALDVGAGIDARGHVTLHVDEVAAVVLGGTVPEVPEADVVEQRRRLEARDVAAQLRRFLVGAQDDRHRIPADRRADPVLDVAVCVGPGFLLRRDRVAVGRRREERRHRPGEQCPLAQPAEKVARAIRALVVRDRGERIDPFLGFARVVILHRAHGTPPRTCADDGNVTEGHRAGRRAECGRRRRRDAALPLRRVRRKPQRPGQPPGL